MNDSKETGKLQSEHKFPMCQFFHKKTKNPGCMIELTPELKEIAFARFGETDETRTKAISQLRELIQALPNEEDRLTDLSDVNLIRFIRMRKYRIEKALDSTVAYMKFYRDNPDCDGNAPASAFVQFEHFLHILEEPDENQRLVMITRPAIGLQVLTPEYVAENPRSNVQLMTWLFNRLSRNVHVQVCGLVILQCYTDLTFWDEIKLGRLLGPLDVLTVLRFLSGALGISLNSIYFYLPPTVISWIFALVRPFLSEKMKSRFHFCGSDLEAVKIEPKSILPQFLGGESPNTRNPTWFQEQVNIDEEKRAQIDSVKMDVTTTIAASTAVESEMCEE